ncbi:hypothetical protein F5Y15DRAFT_99385 [Xylariaceae sp. FL0016]|nr:hypothetical protein F5Y15DRAFT_99385 [Xylariaceae sp. FL0016]
MDTTEQGPRASALDGVDGIDHAMSPGIKEELVDEHDDTTFGNIDWAYQEQKDNREIAQLFDQNGTGNNMPTGIDGFGEKQIDQTNKADDAVDFEDMDLSDEDLESATGSTAAAPGTTASQVPGLTEDEGTSHDTEGMDDLFGDHEFPPSSPPPEETSRPLKESKLPSEKPMIPQDVTDEAWNNMSFEEQRKLNFPVPELSIDRWLINQTSGEGSMEKAPENADQLLQQKFPEFAKNKILHFNKLLPEWPAEYLYKEPPHKDRDPPEFVPTRLEVELDADTTKLFRIPGGAQRSTRMDTDEWGHAVGDTPLDADDGLSDSDSDLVVGGYTLHEISTICDNYEDSLTRVIDEDLNGVTEVSDNSDDEWKREFLDPRPKKKRLRYEPGLPDISSYDSRGFSDFEGNTRRTSKRVRLDVDDPYLLIDDVQSQRPVKRLKTEEKTKRMANGQLKRDIMSHFNISNDDAYDALKLNHKSKVRATLSSLGVEHSMPAQKLTFPHYRTKIGGGPWEFHRGKLELDRIVKHNISVRKPAKVKRKDMKGKSAQEVFKTTKDLSLNDNSTAILFEYSEQNPIMLSNFGMGSRVINYYRRKERGDDEKLPKLDIGETHSLLPEDRSPFSIFGTVDPGETVPTLHNEMYRAPVFKHNPRSNDFLLGYTTNATEGPKWFVRNIDHVFTVGQTFPSLEVPGPHARKVTNTSKNRLKMIAYRMMRKKPSQDVTLNDITPHVFDKHDPQNRQKMKEFLAYSKEKRTWVLPEGQTMLEEPAIRAMIKPEDVCLIHSMQVGQQLMENAGYDSKAKEDNDDEKDPLVVQLAPWRISKNFLEASAGKAMVELHGEGDPTGHGLGFSFIKTSMKGGYINAVQGPLATSADAIERERKANGGHSYNVKKQQDMYNTAIRGIWQRQRDTLTDSTTHDDGDVVDTANEDDRFNNRQAEFTPAPIDDGRSQFSRLSGASRYGKRKLRITRKKRNDAGEIVSETVTIDDPIVARNYSRQRAALDQHKKDVYNLKPTGDADEDRERQRYVDRELARLMKNQERRQIREKQGKGKKKNAVANASINGDASPDPSSADKASAGTTRKCANCGQVGHIKTNKSKCPLLNGTITTNNNAADHGGFGSFSAPSASAIGE